ncbi:autotransporter domain-containing protein [Terrihabitans sp. B22-R8]|uniref:autotransporter domain-containing protein n=1 Tax=Terrihabitans sp. B22-R8 TaxID=3425128 RepID=UPI00403C3704
MAGSVICDPGTYLTGPGDNIVYSNRGELFLGIQSITVSAPSGVTLTNGAGFAGNLNVVVGNQSGNPSAPSITSTSGDAAIRVIGNDDVSVSVLTGSVNAVSSNGIFARSTAGNAQANVAAGTTVTGLNGINLQVIGENTVTANVAGTVTGTTGSGILTGARDGLTSITLEDSAVVSGEENGIYARTDDGAVQIDVASGAEIYSAGDGIYVEANTFGTASEGVGAIEVTNRGLIRGPLGEGEEVPAPVGDDGIQIEANSPSPEFGGAGILVRNIGGGTIYADDDGIDIDQEGAGSVVVYNGESEEGAGFIQAGDNGIEVSSQGGDIVVVNAGAVDEEAFSGILAGGDGIRAVTGGDGDVGVVNGGYIQAGDRGILARVDDTGTTGDVYVENYGSVFAEGVAIRAEVLAGNGDVTIENYGDGVGFPDFFGPTSQGAFSLSDSALMAINLGSGETEIYNASLAIGAGTGLEEAVVRIRTAAGSDGVELYNEGFIGSLAAVNALISYQNGEGSAADLGASAEDYALYASGDTDGEGSLPGAGGEYVNEGLLIGRIELDSEEANVFVNDGQWVTRGTSDFGEGTVGETSDGDEFYNYGLISAAFEVGVGETTSFTGLEYFYNEGTISLLDNDFSGFGGVENDVLNISGSYEGDFGRIALDARLGEAGNSSADVVNFVDADAVISGVTSLLIVDHEPTSGGGFNADGIPLVRVASGNVSLDNFFIDEESTNYDSRGVIDKGFYIYGLVERDGDGSLGAAQRDITLIGVPDVEGFQAASIITGAQEIWHNTTAIYSDRHADLRNFIMAGVDSRAELADLPASGPAPTTTAGNVTPGLWARGFGSWVEKDSTSGADIVGIPGFEAAFDTGFSQDIYGMTAGIDFGREGLWSPNDALLGGVFAGYLASDLDFNVGGSSIDYEGFTVGGYASFIKGAFFVDATIKADFLDIEGAGGVFGDVSTDATTIGGTLEAGYRVWFERFFVEPNAVLAYAQTDIDDVAGLDFQNDAESLRGGIGLKVGGNIYKDMVRTVEFSVTGRAWNEFEGENQVSLTGLGGFDVVDQGPEDVYGEVGGTISVASRLTGWSGQVAGSYKFNDDYEAASVKGGVRYQW